MWILHTHEEEASSHSVNLGCVRWWLDRCFSGKADKGATLWWWHPIKHQQQSFMLKAGQDEQGTRHLCRLPSQLRDIPRILDHTLGSVIVITNKEGWEEWNSAWEDDSGKGKLRKLNELQNLANDAALILVHSLYQNGELPNQSSKLLNPELTEIGRARHRCKRNRGRKMGETVWGEK